MKTKAILSIFAVVLSTSLVQAQSWQLWASGLPVGSFPRMTVSASHDVYYTLMTTGGTRGEIYKANALSPTGTFNLMPLVPVPASLQNNIFSIVTNQNNELIAGVFRTNIADPWVFRFNNNTQQWVAATIAVNPSLGAYSMARSPNGTLWVGAKWTWVYKSTDNGTTYTRINESAIVQSAYPCYYPSWYGQSQDGAIYGVNVDANGRVYVGTESAGMLYSDDDGITWKPADYHACKTTNMNQKDTNSVMHPLAYSGNCAGIGFTSNNNLIWSGGEMWIFNWANALACADMTNHTVTPAAGIPLHLITSGQQVSKIVTTTNGQVFLHSGGSSTATGIGIYTSMDGINWTLINNGITGLNDGRCQGSLAVDGNTVFMATSDGNVWRYQATATSSGVESAYTTASITLFPNPASTVLQLHFKHVPDAPVAISIYSTVGQLVKQVDRTQQVGSDEISLDIASLPEGVYQVMINAGAQSQVRKLVVQR